MSTVFVFIDTNVLLHAAEMRINLSDMPKSIINTKFQIVVHPKVEMEIIDAMTKPGKIARQARLAIQLSSQFDSYTDDEEYPGADIALIHSAQRENGCIFTFDKELIQRSKEIGIPVLTAFRRSKLILIGHLE